MVVNGAPEGEGEVRSGALSATTYDVYAASVTWEVAAVSPPAANVPSNARFNIDRRLTLPPSTRSVSTADSLPVDTTTRPAACYFYVLIAIYSLQLRASKGTAQWYGDRMTIGPGHGSIDPPSDWATMRRLTPLAAWLSGSTKW